MPIGSANWIPDGMLGGLANVTTDGQVVGFRFEIVNQIFHGTHPLGWMSSFAVLVDGDTMPSDSVSFELREQRFPASLLPDVEDVWWHAREVATIRVQRAGGLGEGAHAIACELRIPTVIFTPLVDRKQIYRTMPVRLEGELTLNGGN